MDDDAPTFERIHTMTHERRETRKRIASSMRKSMCAKKAFTRKQGLTRQNTLLKQGVASYLRIYRCKKCHSWHLTHKPPRYGR